MGVALGRWEGVWVWAVENQRKKKGKNRLSGKSLQLNKQYMMIVHTLSHLNFVDILHIST